MYTIGSRRKRSSPRRVLILLILIGTGIWLLINQSQVRQQITPPPTPTATRTAKSYVVEAKSLQEAGDMPGTINAYIQAVSLEQDNLDVLLELTRLLTLRDRTKEALPYAERAALIAPKDVRAQAAYAMTLDWHASWLRQRGRELEANDTFQKAIVTAKAAISLDPKYADAYAYLAETYADLNDIPSAIDNAQTAVELDPNRTDVQRAVGYVRESQGNYTGAVEAYQRAIELAPKEINLYMVLGQNYRILAQVRDATNWQRALETFNKAIEIDPSYGPAYDELGWTYYTLEDFKKAQDTLEKAIEVDPTAWSARSHLAATYYTRRNYEDAAATFKVAIQLMNDAFDADHYCVTARTRACDRVVVAYATMGVANCYLAASYKDEAKYYDGAAVPAFRRALTIRPDDEGVLENMDLCNYILGKPLLRTPTPRPLK